MSTLRDVELDIEANLGHEVDLEPEIEGAVRLSVESFELLCAVLEVDLQRDVVDDYTYDLPSDDDDEVDYDDGDDDDDDDDEVADLTPASRLYLTLRWLETGDECCWDLMLLFGISRKDFYRIVWSTVDAILNSDDALLDNLHFPKTTEELEEAAEGFRSLSESAAIYNCVSVIDGFLLEIRPPSGSPPYGENAQSSPYFSKHCLRYGLNVQAAVDCHGRFQFIAVVGPANLSDQDAARECGLQDEVDKTIPAPYVAIGDAGYTATDALATAFTSYHASKDPDNNESFNYYAGPLIVRAGMAFGGLIEAWGILQKPRKVGLPKVQKIVGAAARLYNFRINEGDGWTGAELSEAWDNHFVPSQPLNKDGRPILEKGSSRFKAGKSIRRDWLVESLQSRGLRRPDSPFVLRKRKSCA